MQQNLWGTRRGWFRAFSLSVGSVATIWVITLGLTQRPDQHPSDSVQFLRLAFGVVSVFLLLLSVVWLQWRTTNKKCVLGEEIISPSKFQTDSIIALGIASTCTFYGLAIAIEGGTWNDAVWFALGTLAVGFAFILPKGIRYWAAWEVAQQSRGPSLFEELK